MRCQLYTDELVAPSARRVLEISDARTHTHVRTLVISLSNKCRAGDEEGNGVGRRVSRGALLNLALAHKRPTSYRCIACIIVLYFLTAAPWRVAIDADADRRSLSSDNHYRVFEFNRVT